LRESVAAAADVFCAKAKHQQKDLSAQKRSGSDSGNNMMQIS